MPVRVWRGRSGLANPFAFGGRDTDRGRARALTDSSCRIVGLDYGRRRIGVAVTDPTRTIASPYAVIAGTGGPAPGPELLRLLRDIDPTTIVLGIPFSMDGSAGEMAQEARVFGQALSDSTGLPVVEWDERLTTAGAERLMREERPTRRGKRRRERPAQQGDSDKVAAALILRGYLARLEGGAD